MCGPKLRTDRFTNLVLDGIVDHAAEAMVEFGFQFGEGFAARVAGIALDIDGRESQALETGKRCLVQFSAEREYHQPGVVCDGFGEDHSRSEFFDHDAFHAWLSSLEVSGRIGSIARLNMSTALWRYRLKCDRA